MHIGSALSSFSELLGYCPDAGMQSWETCHARYPLCISEVLRGKYFISVVSSQFCFLNILQVSWACTWDGRTASTQQGCPLSGKNQRQPQRDVCLRCSSPSDHPGLPQSLDFYSLFTICQSIAEKGEKNLQFLYFLRCFCMRRYQHNKIFTVFQKKIKTRLKHDHP